MSSLLTQSFQMLRLTCVVALVAFFVGATAQQAVCASGACYDSPSNANNNGCDLFDGGVDAWEKCGVQGAVRLSSLYSVHLPEIHRCDLHDMPALQSHRYRMHAVGWRSGWPGNVWFRWSGLSSEGAGLSGVSTLPIPEEDKKRAMPLNLRLFVSVGSGAHRRGMT
ncbi:hypothetical protein C8J57DRAFT_1327138 [Mycena rebaudengoi]|nr:hypothetical protein C8J57DRAFT_1327138 [Mycena rebaudengoi]